MRNNLAHKLSDPGSTTLAVTLEEVKEHLRFDETDEDQHLERLILAATRKAEEHQARRLINRTITVSYKAWPCVYADGCWQPGFALPLGPYQGTPVLTYVDTAGATQTLVIDDDYEVDDVADPAIVVPAFGVAWPIPKSKRNAVAFSCVVGYGTDDASVPESTRHAIARLVGHWFANRENLGTMPADVADLLDVESCRELG